MVSKRDFGGTKVSQTHTKRKRECVSKGERGKREGDREKESIKERERETHTHTYTQGESDTHAQTERKRWRRKKERKIEGDKVIHNLVESLVGVTCSHLN